MNAKQLWQTVLGDLRTSLSRTAFDNWLRDTRLIAFDEDVATIAAQSSIVVATLESRFAPRVASALSDAVGRQVGVRFTVFMQSSVEDDAMNRETAALLGVAPGTAVPPSPSRQARPDPRRSGEQVSARARDHGRVPPPRQIELAAQSSHGLNPRYVYDNYVVGSSNRFAHAASLSVAEHPGGKYNPFFVHGGVGLGKTHLLHAVGHRALELRPNLLISYVTSEKFTNDLIAAIRQQRMDEFRGRYREIDLLMIDDIQFIAGKESTQEEFFHTFNALYQSGKQVLITSDRPPKAISALEDRLRSRFEGGLIADVQLPDYEMRTAILRTKGEELNVLLPADVVEYIAQKDQSNIRELEGGLNKVIARAQLADQPISLSLAMEALTDSAIGARRAKLSASGVVSAVGRHFGVEVDAIAGRGRSKEIVLPRQVAMFLLREETDASLLEIGRTLGGRDHTTVLHGIRQIERALTTDVGLRSQIMAIREAMFSASAT
ncbi:MAG TPA: chromosomal replication initiator protein DnaA [Thermomicrobiales bacterium]|nr:chromosomal replication initiator protein DnaA [Thermomicrobiales bacterium]